MVCVWRPTRVLQHTPWTPHAAAVLRAGWAAFSVSPLRAHSRELCAGIFRGQEKNIRPSKSEFASLRTHAAVAHLAWFPPVVKQAVHAIRRPISASPACERCLHSSVVLRTLKDEASASSESRSEVVDVLYDGECPLCVHEITWLRRRNQVVDL